MKLLSIAMITAGMLLLSACGNTTRFPVSSYAPAADIKAKTKMDQNNNHVITVTAKNLASPGRLDSANQAYVIWIKTDDNKVVNLGQLRNENAETASLTTVTPYNPDEIFITLERSGNVSSPSGTEISRAEMTDPFTSDTETIGDENDMDRSNNPSGTISDSANFDSNSGRDNDLNYDNDSGAGTNSGIGSETETERTDPFRSTSDTLK